MKYLGVALLVFFSSLSYGYSSDSGKVTRVFATAGGAFAVQIKGGFHNAIANSECVTNNGWAGHSSADPVLKSGILAAKASNQSITVITEGCNGSWLKIRSIYIN